MNISFGLNAVFILLFILCLQSNSGSLTDLLLVNGALQMILFTAVACIPFLRTGRISFVDIAWPFGVALIGIQILLWGDADGIYWTVVGAVYLFIGLRMGIAALIMGKKTGVIFKTEFPRYQYRKMIVEKSGSKNPNLHYLAEIMAQGFANATVLALPGFLIATNTSASLASLEVIGILLWATAYALESIADAQKLVFISQHPQAVCNVGLWRYSRHPNYFAEWLAWTGLVIAAIPSWLAHGATEPTLTWIIMGAGGALASVMMYITLVYLTGAKPAEYFSVQKRKEYRNYQQTTNMFFPWIPRAADQSKSAQVEN